MELGSCYSDFWFSVIRNRDQKNNSFLHSFKFIKDAKDFKDKYYEETRTLLLGLMDKKLEKIHGRLILYMVTAAKLLLSSMMKEQWHFPQWRDG